MAVVAPGSPPWERPCYTLVGEGVAALAPASLFPQQDSQALWAESGWARLGSSAPLTSPCPSHVCSIWYFLQCLPWSQSTPCQHPGHNSSWSTSAWPGLPVRGEGVSGVTLAHGGEPRHLGALALQARRNLGIKGTQPEGINIGEHWQLQQPIKQIANNVNFPFVGDDPVGNQYIGAPLKITYFCLV